MSRLDYRKQLPEDLMTSYYPNPTNYIDINIPQNLLTLLIRDIKILLTFVRDYSSYNMNDWNILFLVLHLENYQKLPLL